MPIRFRYDPARDLLIHVGEGPVTIEEIEALRRERRQAGVPAGVANTLTDMRRAHFAFDPAELKANEQGRSSDHYGGTRHAELVDDPHPTAILLLWKKWLPADVVVEVFSTVDAAYEWLGIEQREGDLEF